MLYITYTGKDSFLMQNFVTNYPQKLWITLWLSYVLYV
jgi:hypothetical protein